MGSRNRAERVSGVGTNRAMKAIIYKCFDGCGNCVLRINCLVEGTLKSGGYNKPLHKIVDDLSNGCIKPKDYYSVGIIPKNVAKVAHNECDGCNKFEICVDNILNYLRIEDKEYRNRVMEQAKKCTKCEDLDKCVQQYMELFRLRSYNMALRLFLLKFRKCKTEEQQMVSLDLDSLEKQTQSSQVINIKSIMPTNKDKKE